MDVILNVGPETNSTGPGIEMTMKTKDKFTDNQHVKSYLTLKKVQNRRI